MRQGMRVTITYKEGWSEKVVVRAADAIVFVVELPSKVIRSIPWTSILHIDTDLADQPKIAVPQSELIKGGEKK